MKAIFFSLICLALVQFSFSQSPLNFNGATKGGSTYEVCLHNNTLYAGCANTLNVYDLTGPNNRPGTLHFQKRFLSNIDQMLVKDDFLYVCANHDGLYKFDLSSNPQNPIMVSHFTPRDLDESVYDVAFYGDTVFLAAKTKLLMLADGPSGFTVLSTVKSFTGTSRIRGLDIKGDYLAFTVGYSPGINVDGVYLYDIPSLSQIDHFIDNSSDPLEVYFGQNTNLLHVMGGVIAFSVFNGRYYALDYSTPSALNMVYADTVKGNILAGGSIASPMSAVVLNDTLYISTQGGGPIGYTFPNPYSGQVYVYDATNAGSITRLTDIYAGLYHFDTDIHPGTRTMYVASEWYGILTLDISDIFNEVNYGKTWTGGWCHGSTAENGKLVEANEGYGIRLFDISNPANPSLIAEDTTVGFCRAVSMDTAGDYIYAWYLTGQRLRVYDGNTLGFLSDTTVDPGVIFVADFKQSRYQNGKLAVVEEINKNNRRIVVADVSNPAQPRVEHIRKKDNIKVLNWHPSGNLIACAEDSLLFFTPVNMTVMASATPPSGGQKFLSAIFSNDTLYAFISGTGEGIATYAIDPSTYQFTYQGTTPFEMSSDDNIYMAASDSILYIASTIDSLKALDKSAPYSQKDIYNHGADFIFDNLWGVHDLYFNEGQLFLNEYMGQTSIFSESPFVALNPEENASPFILYPNPTDGMVNIQFDPSFQPDLQVFDLNGKAVFSSEKISNQYSMSTESFSPGIYLLKLSDGQKAAYRRLVIRR